MKCVLNWQKLAQSKYKFLQSQGAYAVDNFVDNRMDIYVDNTMDKQINL